MIPSKVMVAGIEYNVEEKDLVVIDGKSSYSGACYFKEAKIEVLADMPLDRKQETLVHEILHAVLNEAGYDEHDEEMVTRASKVLYQVLKDNHLYFGKKEIETDCGQKMTMNY